MLERDRITRHDVEKSRSSNLLFPYDFAYFFSPFLENVFTDKRQPIDQ